MDDEQSTFRVGITTVVSIPRDNPTIGHWVPMCEDSSHLATITRHPSIHPSTIHQLIFLSALDEHEEAG